MKTSKQSADSYVQLFAICGYDQVGVVLTIGILNFL